MFTVKSIFSRSMYLTTCALLLALFQSYSQLCEYKVKYDYEIHAVGETAQKLLEYYYSKPGSEETFRVRIEFNHPGKHYYNSGGNCITSNETMNQVVEEIPYVGLQTHTVDSYTFTIRCELDGSADCINGPVYEDWYADPSYKSGLPPSVTYDGPPSFITFEDFRWGFINGADNRLFKWTKNDDTTYHNTDGNDFIRKVHFYFTYDPITPEFVNDASHYVSTDHAFHPEINHRPRLLTLSSEYETMRTQILANSQVTGQIRTYAAKTCNWFTDGTINTAGDADLFEDNSIVARDLAMVAYFDMVSNDEIKRLAAEEAGNKLRDYLRNVGNIYFPSGFAYESGWEDYHHACSQAIRNWAIAIDLLEATPFRGTATEVQEFERNLQTFVSNFVAMSMDCSTVMGLPVCDCIDVEKNNWRVRLGGALMLAAMTSNLSLLEYHVSGIPPPIDIDAQYFRPYWWWQEGMWEDVYPILIADNSNSNGQGYFEGYNYYIYGLDIALPAMVACYNFFKGEIGTAPYHTSTSYLLPNPDFAKSFVWFASSIIQNGDYPEIPDDEGDATDYTKHLFMYLDKVYTDWYPDVYASVPVSAGDGSITTAGNAYGPDFFRWCYNIAPGQGLYPELVPESHITEYALVGRKNESVSNITAPKSEYATTANRDGGMAILRSGWNSNDSYLFFNAEWGELVEYQDYPDVPCSTHEQRDAQAIIYRDCEQDLLIEAGGSEDFYESHNTRFYTPSAYDPNSIDYAVYEVRRKKSPVHSSSLGLVYDLREHALSGARWVISTHTYLNNNEAENIFERFNSKSRVVDWADLNFNGVLYWHGNDDGTSHTSQEELINGYPYGISNTWQVSGTDFTILTLSDHPISISTKTWNTPHDHTLATLESYKPNQADFDSFLYPGCLQNPAPVVWPDGSEAIDPPENPSVIEAYNTGDTTSRGRGIVCYQPLSDMAATTSLICDTVVTISDPTLNSYDTQIIPVPSKKMCVALTHCIPDSDPIITKAYCTNVNQLKIIGGTNYYVCEDTTVSDFALWYTEDTVRIWVTADSTLTSNFSFYVDSTRYTEISGSGYSDAYQLGNRVYVTGKGDIIVDVARSFPKQSRSQFTQIPRFGLDQNYPNPFNPVTTIRYSIPEESRVVLSVYNALGQHIKTLVDELQFAGRHSVKFDGSNLPSGIYKYKLETGRLTDSKTMYLLK